MDPVEGVVGERGGGEWGVNSIQVELCTTFFALVGVVWTRCFVTYYFCRCFRTPPVSLSPFEYQREEGIGVSKMGKRSKRKKKRKGEQMRSQRGRQT